MKKLEYLLDKFFEISDKIGKHNVMLIAFIVIVLIITGLYSTFSIFTSTDGVEVVDGLTTYKFVLDPSLSVDSVIVPANSEKNLDVVVTNSENIALKYGLYYSAIGEVILYSTSSTTNAPIDILEKNGVAVVSLKAINNTSSDITITLGLSYGFENGGNLVLPEGNSWISDRVVVPVNAPNLDDGSLIPVYYDESAEVWKKADWSNTGSTWYNYDEKRWANAVMISDATKRSTYQSASVGTVVSDADISAFMVWIPRFKYRVWNINRQPGDEATYAYSAYTNGIDIEWESGVDSTGNVVCTYDTTNSSPSTTLSDVCVYNDTDMITPESINSNYQDVWYTHPAFNFVGVEKTGFWIGKFETNGTSNIPTVLPDEVSLKTNLTDKFDFHFEVSENFQTYGLSEFVNAHMLTNLEWAAMAYLTHSIYGLCDGTTSCRDVYTNNSSDFYTGRSSGVLSLDSVDSTYGTYNYKGYSIDSSTGLPSNIKDITKIASTTGNITGVYDVVGGVQELLTYKEYFEFDDSSNLYYTPYSSGGTGEYNRSKLGDATAEVVGGMPEDNYSMLPVWQPNTSIIGSYAVIPDEMEPWFVRSSDSSFGFGIYGELGVGAVSLGSRLAVS